MGYKWVNITRTCFPDVFSAVCDNRAYTYVRKLNKCIRRSSGQVTFADARASCQADGGDLLMVKEEDTRLYLKDIMTSVTGTGPILVSNLASDFFFIYLFIYFLFAEKLCVDGVRNIIFMSKPLF